MLYQISMNKQNWLALKHRNKIIFLVIASDNPEHVLDESTQKITWGRDNLEEILWLRGGTKTEFNTDKRTLKVEVSEEYHNILRKTIEGMRWLLSNQEFEFLIRANVSTYFDVNRVHEYLSTVTTNDLFLGGYIDFLGNKDGNNSKENVFVNGGAIFLNRKSVKALERMNAEDWLNLPDDVAISRFLINQGAIPTYIPRSNTSNTGFLRKRMYFRMKSSENKSMASLRMLKLDQINQSSSKKEKLRHLFDFHLQEVRYFRINFRNPVRYGLSVYSICSSSIRARRIRKRWSRTNG